MRYAPCIVQNGLLKPENDEQRNDRIQILKALAAIRWSRELGGYCVLFSRFDALTGEPVSSGRKLDSLDPRWLALLTDPKVSQDGAIYNLSLPQHYRKTEPALDSLIPWLIDRDNPEICEPAGHWLYRRMMDTGNIQELFHPLLGCGWKNWQGVLAHIYRKQGQISYPMTTSLLRMMPLSNAEKAAELRQLNEMAQSKQLKIQYNFWPQEAILRDIAALEADPNAQL